MKRNHAGAMAVGLLALWALTAKAEQDVITKTFPVKAGGKLIMNVDRGSIHITTSDSDNVNVRVTRELKNTSDAEARKMFEQYKIEMSSSANEVTIEAQNASKLHPSRFNRLRVDYTVAIPARFDIDLKTAGGNIEVGDLEGKAEVRSSGGNLKLGAVKDTVKARTSGGSITLTKSEGNVDVETSGGDLRLGEIKGNVVAHTSGGRITAEKTMGSIRANTSGGDIRVEGAYGAVTARTSGGSVSAHLNGQPRADCSLETSGGRIEVVLASNLALDVDAHTSGGSVSSDFPGTLNREKTRLTARLNGGGTALALETSGGNVNIRSK